MILPWFIRVNTHFVIYIIDVHMLKINIQLTMTTTYYQPEPENIQKEAHITPTCKNAKRKYTGTFIFLKYYFILIKLIYFVCLCRNTITKTIQLLTIYKIYNVV